ncbi:helix-turn-helix domain-containing protein [Fervidibacillus halotolerans]|uniref:Helix-turn-helix domain-containing protein n=1 Tax=Fervidibacillus halotolerans TaxID=2980027 RepID=A0A9E8M0R7_9BACI|nr:helix-turn-helix transcriptional regulator [Fervidibacillus halotolerans]WAA13393.1 helix-turn-helix domain-containing protein [Fervidibacillus halotolerans]
MNQFLIKRVRQMKGMSQLEFSKALGVSRSLIAQVEGGYINPSDDLVEKIREFVGDDFINAVKALMEVQK